MTLIINKDSPEKIAKLLENKLSTKSRSGKLNKHFGKLKRKIEGLNYQKLIRANED